MGAPITWTYKVTNTGEIDLTNVVVTDDKLGAVGTIPSLPKGASETLSMTGAAIKGPYDNVGTATAYGPLGDKATASDPSSYFGQAAQIDVVKIDEWWRPVR